MRSRTKPRTQSHARILAALMCVGAMSAGAETAKPEQTKSGSFTDAFGTLWTVNAPGVLSRATLPFRKGWAVSLRVDGQSFTLGPTVARPSSTTDDAKKTAESETSVRPPELEGDARFSGRFPASYGITWERHVRQDPVRGGVRFLDVMTHNGTRQHQITLRYDNEMDVPNSDSFQGATTQTGDIISNDDSTLSDAISGVMLHFTPDLTAALPFFVIGAPQAPWTSQRRQSGYQLSIEYSGTLVPGERAVWVHWVGARGAKEKGRPEKAFARFFADGKLIDPGVPAEWIPSVVNFPKEAFASAQRSTEADGVKLVMLDLLCKRLGFPRDDADHLVLQRATKIDGELKAAQITLKRNSKSLVMDVAKVAAISGGAGQGREHHVFLRDGSVLAGRVTLEGAVFTSAGFGTVAVSADALDHLILSTSSAVDGRAVAPDGVAQSVRGEILHLASLPPKPLACRTSAGVAEIAWSEIASIRERANPDPCFVVSLKDGSRVVCLPDFQSAIFELAGGGEWHAAAELSGYTASPAEVESLLTVEKDSEEKPAGSWCELTRGTIWAGRVADEEWRFATNAGVTTLKAAELKSIRRAENETVVAAAGAVFDVELTSGSKLRGRFASAMLRWERGAQVLGLPWSEILEIKMEGKK